MTKHTIMTTYKVFFFSPGGDPGGGNSENSSDLEESGEQNTSSTNTNDDDKTVGEKIREALQDWSNKDQQDQDFDDTQV